MDLKQIFGLGKRATDARPVAHELQFEGSGAYSIPFPGTGYGLVFEDDGGTGYLYATDEAASVIFDALHIYDSDDNQRLNPGDECFVVWNESITKAGLFFNGEFHAIVDFARKQACCRSGFPQGVGEWGGNHQWMPGAADGLG